MGDSSRPKTTPGAKGEKREGTIDYAGYIITAGYSDFVEIAEAAKRAIAKRLNA